MGLFQDEWNAMLQFILAALSSLTISSFGKLHFLLFSTTSAVLFS
jgi:hypothetical protein